MSTTGLVIVLILLFGRRGANGGRIDMVALSNESRDRYLADWDRVETRFVDAPAEAVREADALVMSVLRERRHPLETRRLPKDVQEARDDASMETGEKNEGERGGTRPY